MSSSETPEICQLLHYARLHGLASKTESSLGPTVGDNYRENYATFLNALNVQRLDISIAAKDLLASVLKEEMVDTRVEWENILPPAPVIGGQSDIVLFVTEKEEAESVSDLVKMPVLVQRVGVEQVRGNQMLEQSVPEQNLCTGAVNTISWDRDEFDRLLVELGA